MVGLLFLKAFFTVCSANSVKPYLILKYINIFMYFTDDSNLSSPGSHFTEDSQRPLPFFCCGNEHSQKDDSYLHAIDLCCIVF